MNMNKKFLLGLFVPNFQCLFKKVIISVKVVEPKSIKCRTMGPRKYLVMISSFLFQIIRDKNCLKRSLKNVN